jgi:hypothetical protein
MRHKILTFPDLWGTAIRRSLEAYSANRDPGHVPPRELVENKYGESARRQAQAEMKKDAVCELVSQTPSGSQTAPVCPHGAGGNTRIGHGEPVFDHQARLAIQLHSKT